MEKSTIIGNRNVCSEHVSTTTTQAEAGAFQRATQETFPLERKKAGGGGRGGKSKHLLGKMVSLSARSPDKAFRRKRSKAKTNAIEYPRYLQNELLKQGNRALELQRSQEARDCYEKALRQVAEQDIALQFFCIKGIGDCLLTDKAYRDAAWYYNYALALCEVPFGQLDRSEREKLLAALKEVERCYIQEVVKYEGSLLEDSLDIEKRRKKLAQVRMMAKQKFDGGVPVEEIQKELTEGLKAFSCELIRDCFAVLPEAPCEYAIMALGSMSRDEMCFYSDLEFAVLLDEKKKEDWGFFAECKNYFVRFSKLLELKMINVGESLNEEETMKNLPEGIFNLVASGFALDGKGSPLSVESLLIDAPERMAAIQRGNKADIIHVSLLEAVCYLYGNRELVDSYKRTVKKIFDGEDPFGSFRSFHEVEALILLNRGSGFLEPEETVLRRFSPKLGEKLVETDSTLPVLNVKQDLYRFPSEAVSKLCIYFEITIHGRSTLERLAALRKKEVISEGCYKNLCELMKKVIRLRLQVHDYYKREEERVYCGEDSKIAEHTEYFKLESTESIVEIYQVLIPLYEALKSFCEKNGDERVNVPSFDKMRAVAEGFVYEKLRDYQRAEEHYREVLFINKDNLEARIGLGQVLYSQGKYEEARACYEVAREKLKKSSQKEHPNLIKVLKGLGLVCSALGNYKKVVAYYKEALKIHGEVYTEGYYFSRAEILRDLGSALNEVGERSEAVHAYREALEIYEKTFCGEDETMGNLKKIGVLNGIIALTEDLKELAELHEQVLSLKKACYGKKHPSVGSTLYNLGTVCRYMGRNKKAVKWLTQALRICVISYGKEDVEVIKILVGLGGALEKLGEYTRSKNLQKKVFKFYGLSLEKESVQKAVWVLLKNDLETKELDLSKKEIEDEDVKILAKALEGNQMLQQLDLSGNNIGDAGVRMLAEVLEKNQVLQKLDLKWNKIGVKETETVGQIEGYLARNALLNDSTITELNLYGKKIGDTGVLALVQAIEQNQTLRKLNLSCNEIGDEGTKALAKVLEKNQTLQQIDFYKNKIGKGCDRHADSCYAINTHSILSSIFL